MLKGLKGKSDPQIRALFLLLLPVIAQLPQPPSGDDDRMQVQ